MEKILELIFTGVSAMTSILGSILVWRYQSSIPNAQLWPLPGLVLLVWAGLGAALFVFVTLSEVHDRLLPGAAWAITGALIPYIVLGGFSIGSIVLTAFLFSLAASIFLTIIQKRQLIGDLLILSMGSFGNLVLFLFFLAFQSVIMV